MEEGLLDPLRVTQIGVRGTGYAADDFDWSRKQGFTVVQAEECWGRSLVPLMDQVRARAVVAPCTSASTSTVSIRHLRPVPAPEIGGLTIWQALEIIRGCRGLNLVGGDLVEVAPAYDTSGNTSLVAANLLYEMLCVLPGVQCRT